MDSIYIERMIDNLSQSGECWLWTKACDSQGYGRMRDEWGLVSIHREMYKLFIGDIPAGMVVMHSCDNPKCGNPKHLSVGTQKQNLEDMEKKGRRAKGNSHGNTKITDEEVKQIRDLLKCGLFLQREIGNFYGVTNKNISLIAMGKSRCDPTMFTREPSTTSSSTAVSTQPKPSQQMNT